MSDYGGDDYCGGGDYYYGDGGDDYNDGGDDFDDGGDDYDDEDDYEDEDEVDVYGDGDDEYEDGESYPKKKYQKDINKFNKQNNNEKDNNYLGKKTNRDIEESNNLDENNEDEDYEGEEGEDEEDENNEGVEEQDSYDFNCETGDIGEKIVYDELKNNKSSGKINWMNKKEESYLPYDFNIKKGNKTIYIDAKSTVYEKGEDPMPVITPNEQEFIDNLKPNEKYYIARVFDARSKNPKVTYYDAKTMEKVPKSKIMK